MNFGKIRRVSPQFILLLILVILYGILVTHKIDLVTADLGRHTKNGEIILQSENRQEAFKNNFYSYTYPDFPFVNHHWGSGVVFFLVNKFFAFNGLSVLNLTISLLTLLIFFKIARKYSSFEICFLVSLLLMPLVSSRIEIRPEIFSYFFAGLFWLWLQKAEEKGFSFKFLSVLPLLMILWVNLHVYFFLGFLLITIFGFEKILKKEWGNVRSLISIGIFCVLACFLNPNGVKGVFYPLTIFNDYGYRLFENQSFWYLDRLVSYLPNLYFKITFAALCLSWFYSLIRKRFSLSFFLLSLFFSCLALKAVRNFALFGLFSLPIISFNLKDLIKESENKFRYFFISLLGGLIFLGLFVLSPNYFMQKFSFGIGLKEGTAAAAEFFLKNNLKGPIFNNYDIGGYLIYYLYPREKVFVDNRPEAYPASFFNEVYVPMQSDEKKWQEMLNKYQFNVIFFSHRDLTEWGQAFLANRVKDPLWKVAYYDDYAVIFIRRDK